MRTVTATAAHDRIVIRLAERDDAVAVHRLAQLDSAAPPAGPVLLAEAGGEARVALSLSDGRAVADPFFPTLHLVALLRVHARELDGRTATGARRGLRLRRRAPAALSPAAGLRAS
jgi:hypothetical protein